jgi:glycosyltransferase involved in cell wall biosynthesis
MKVEALNPVAHGHAEVGDLPLSIVIPIFNEQAILAENLGQLARYYDELVGQGNWIFILVDNGSTDDTPKIVQEASRRWPLLRSIQLGEPNYGAALKAGLRAATTNWVYLLDIEQWDFPFMTWAWRKRNRFDVFIGSKRADPTLNHQQPYRRFLSAGLNGTLQLFFGFSGSDTHGPKLLNRRSLDAIIQACQLDRGQFDTELVLRAIRARKELVEVPVEYRESRPHRNWMLKKIFWNIFALRRLQRVMHDVPFEGCIRYYGFSREDVLADIQPAAAPSKGQARV